MIRSYQQDTVEPERTCSIGAHRIVQYAYYLQLFRVEASEGRAKMAWVCLDCAEKAIEKWLLAKAKKAEGK